MKRVSPSVCMSVCLSHLSAASSAAGLLLWTRQPGALNQWHVAGERGQCHVVSIRRQLNTGLYCIVFQLITAQEDILIKERELESARKKLEIIRSAKYKNRPSDYDSTDSGTDF